MSGPYQGSASPGTKHAGWIPLFIQRCSCLALLLPLAACKQAAQAALPAVATSYIFTDHARLELLSWQVTTNGTIAGQWASVIFTLPLMGSSHPQVTTTAITGQQQGQRIILNLWGIVVEGHRVGTTLHVALGTTGAPQVWYAASARDYQSLLPYFEADLVLTGAMADVTDAILHLPADSNPMPLLHILHQVNEVVPRLRATLATLQRTAASCATVATLLQAYVQAGKLFLVHNKSPNQSTLAKRIQAAQLDWQQMLSLTPPSPVPGLALPWLLSSEQVARVLLPAQQQLTTLAALVNHSSTQITMLHKQYMQLSNQMRFLKRRCHLTASAIGGKP